MDFGIVQILESPKIRFCHATSLYPKTSFLSRRFRDSVPREWSIDNTSTLDPWLRGDRYCPKDNAATRLQGFFSSFKTPSRPGTCIMMDDSLKRLMRGCDRGAERILATSRVSSQKYWLFFTQRSRNLYATLLVVAARLL